MTEEVLNVRYNKKGHWISQLVVPNVYQWNTWRETTALRSCL